MSESTDMRHKTATPDVTSIKLSTPNPASEMLPANAPATTATMPSRVFQANGEIFQASSASRYQLTIDCKLCHSQSIRLLRAHRCRGLHLGRHDLARRRKIDFIVCWKHNWPECPLEVL